MRVAIAVRHPREPPRLRGGDRRRRGATAPRSCGASATSSATAATRTPPSRSRARHCAVVPGRQPRPRRRRRPLAGGVLARRGARRQLDARRDLCPRRASSCSRSSPQGSAEGVGLFHASPRDPVWEYVLSGLTAELCFDVTDFRVSLIGHSHVALSFDRQEGSPATGHHAQGGHRAGHRDGPVADQPRLDGPAARRRPARRLAAARHRPLDRRATAARSTTSRARRRRSGPPTCRTRSPSACSTASKAR